MAAEAPLKRQRVDTFVEDVEEAKKHKSYNHIVSLLEEEDEPNQDLSSIITTLQQELVEPAVSCSTTETYQDSSFSAITTTIEDYPSSSSSSSSSSLKEDEEDDKDRVIRHLLEASDDELGIPNREISITSVDDGHDGFVSSGSGFSGSVDGFSLCDGLWEIEDANANYYDYALLQSELFM